MQNICFQKQTARPLFLCFKKCGENKIVRAGLAQPTQPDGMHKISSWQAYEMRDIDSIETKISEKQVPNAKYWR